MPVKPKKASTVSVLRDNSGRMEILLMRRHADDRFLPDYDVFPGGALDPQDYDYEFPESKRIRELIKFKNDSKNYYAHILCGIRETFEESGILFAVNDRGEYPQINTPESVEKFTSYRRLVFEQKITFREMLINENLHPAVDNCYYIDRWITPIIFPIRYDARFFAAIAPDNQQISHDGDELVDFRWLTPDDALREYKEGSVKLVMPTINTIRFLSGFISAVQVTGHLGD